MLKFVKRKPSSKNKFNTKANLLYRFLIISMILKDIMEKLNHTFQIIF